MIYAGLDIGSRTTKLAILRDGRLDFDIRDTGPSPGKTCTSLLDGKKFDRITATGYGRHFVRSRFDFPVVTEILACAKGAHYFNPAVRTVVDVGGQDSKVIALGENGSFTNFLMNDRCAAGTGKFLEMMASTLHLSLEEFARLALEADSPVEINSMCSVFAESEVVSLIASGADVKSISLGLHRAVVNRIIALIGKVGSAGQVMFAGGVARNPAAVQLLERKLGKEVFVGDCPQFTAAAGAALITVSDAR